MGDKKRYVVKIYDRQTGAEYEFDGDSLEHFAEKGVQFSDNIYAGNVIEPNGHLRYTFKLWEGFDKWSDFKTGNRVVKDNG